MKRTPLRRTKGLKRGAKGLKRSKLSQVSKEKEPYQEEYNALRATQRSQGWVVCGETGQRVPFNSRQPHHVNRRLGINLLIFVCITSGLHQWIESHSKEARKQGWLRNKGQGYPPDPNQPRPWFPGSLVNENLLSE